MDGVDAVLCEITTTNCSTIAATSVDYAQPLLDALNALCRKSDDELNNFAIADRLVAETFAKAVTELLEKANLKSNDITAIGSHGQTVRHYPKGTASSSLFSSELVRGFTCQIGDPNTIAVLTGIDVVADFRRKDIALGGQGAPLVKLITTRCLHTRLSTGYWLTSVVSPMYHYCHPKTPHDQCEALIPGLAIH